MRLKQSFNIFFPGAVEIDAENKPEENDKQNDLFKGEIFFQCTENAGAGRGGKDQGQDNVKGNCYDKDQGKPEKIRPVIPVGNNILESSKKEMAENDQEYPAEKYFLSCFLNVELF